MIKKSGSPPIPRSGYRPSLEEFIEKSKKGNLIPVYREIFADTETPVSVFQKIRNQRYSYLLESVEGGEKWGRYSFLGVDPAIVIKGYGTRVEVTRNGKTETITAEGGPLQVLKQILSEFRPVEIPGLPRFFGGAVGCIGYDAIRFFEKIDFKNKTESGPDFFFLVDDTLLIFDNVTHNIKVVSNAFIQDENPEEVYHRAIEKIDSMVKRFSRSPSSSNSEVVEGGAPGSSSHDGKTPKSNFTRESFKKAVLAAKEYIVSGDIFQAQISQRFSTPIHTDPFQIYRALRSINPSPYMYYLQFEGLQLVGTSPEVLVRLEDHQVEVRPIAGTRRRGNSPEEDQALAKELLADPKECAEHVMLIDLGRNDIGRVCRYGTVKVDELMIIERYSHVMHIVSNVVGELEKGKDAFDVLQACFPAGTVTGAPKIRAMEIIDELEPEGRGFYAGAVGYFSFQGNMDTCITIRTIIIQDGQATVQAAAGIVADSDPDREYEETMNKARAMLCAIEMAEKGLG